MSYLMHGDCLDLLPEIPDAVVDFVLTDPPYLVNYHDRSGRSIANDVHADWLAPAFAEAFRVLRNDALCASFYGWTRTDLFFDAWKRAGFRIVGHIVFAKPYASKARFVKYQHESAYLLAKGSPAVPAVPVPDVIPWKYSGNRHHPTEKPLGCLKPLIETFTQSGDVVLDPFAGSGSTCVAAQQLDRRYIGIELDATYYASAQARLSNCAAIAG
ncbi:site-specific DNA-methyltransferase (adenine-specific) [Paraburkholderia terricola]|uniref:DNA methyltransferase n=1 Tax=Paraburkholderia terricola TaxID=169427 RepID=UPI0028592FCE|nr:DNA methyltransferase [Paraburkholderia terricola]MDR6495979.1 site-specific DNA-methyltransferase (adenine-specific) [Paraburkholderia terricola]